MKRLILCTVVALLSGCTAGTSGASGPQAYCQRQARTDPQVKRLTMQQLSAAGGPMYTTDRIRLAKRHALQRCLRAKGLPVSGGVEPLAPTW